jgi:hypothetical protein
MEDDQMTTRVIDTDAREEEREDDERWIESESGGRGGWDDDGDDDVIPPRPRGRLLRPLPLALIALIIAAAGFLGGIEAQKGSEGGSGTTAGLGGGGLPNFAALKEGRSAAGGSESKASEASPPGFGASSAAATGTVTSVEGHTIYVKESDGTTVAVTVGDGATVTRDSNVATKKIHPGDTVTVEGSKHGSTVRASSVSATESGVEPTTTGLGATATSGGSESETSVESLFEE